FVRVGIENVDNRVGQDGEADAHGQGDHRGDAQGGLGDFARRAIVPSGDGRGNGGDDGDGQRRYEGRREVIQREHGGVGAVQRVGKLAVEHGVQQPDVDEVRVQLGDHALDGRAEGYRHADFYEFGEGALYAGRLIRGGGERAVGAALYGHV